MACGSRRRRGGRVGCVESLETRALLSTPGARLFVGVKPSRLAPVEQTIATSLAPLSLERLAGGTLLVSPGIDVNQAVRVLRRTPGVRFVERDSSIKVQAISPNDPLYSRQWGLENPNDVDINAGAAWQLTPNNHNTIVAVIDSGIDIHHPDLAGRLWVNHAEIAGNGFDDDRNGFIDDIYGWNFLENNGNVRDDASHGSHVAGIIAAAGNNNLGVAGVDWTARIMALKFIDAAGDGAVSNAVRAIYYAVNNGARVINASWGGPTPSKALNDAIRFASNRGVVFVTASGNESSNNDNFRSYPANYRLPNVIVVAAVDSTGKLAGFSNFGRTTVDIAAPGVNIWSTLPGGGYGTISGTSMAAPFVSGVASLLIGQNPNRSPKQVVQRILATAKPLPSLTARTISGGMVDAARAVSPAPAPAAKPAANSVKKAPAAARRVTTRLSAIAGDNTRATILGSDEYFTLNGGTHQSFLVALYRDVLDRPTKPSEIRNWIASLNAGADRTQIARSVLGTPEAQRTKVARWFQGDLGSLASTAALKNSQPVIKLANRLVNKVPESTVRASLLGSRDYWNIKAGSALAVVAGYYQRILGRDVSHEEAAPWVARMTQGAKSSDVAHALLTSTEGRITRVAFWFQGDLKRPASLAELKSDPGVISSAARLMD